MKIPKRISFLAITFSSTFSLHANELKFNNFTYDQFKEEQSIYEPNDKLDEYIIQGVTYSTKFVPLMNDGAGGGEHAADPMDDRDFGTLDRAGEVPRICRTPSCKAYMPYMPECM